ncbi:MFS transporter [Saccharopolyspora sp. NPDC002376]
MTAPQEQNTTPNTTAEESLNTPHMRRVLLSSFLGSAIEFYDLMLYAAAASLVFGPVFFAHMSPGLALFASFGTMAAGYLARPLGGLIFGPIGDRKGRKTVLISTLVLMGVASALIGLLPSYATIGAAAPVLLVLLRVVQGIAVGGEWGGSMLVALEHAPGGKRGFAASFANLGGPAGTVTATAVLGLFALLPDDAFYSWGWRAPFVISFGLVAFGLFVRAKVAETPVFERLAQAGEAKATPVREVFGKHWKPLALAIAAGITPYVVQGLFVVWSTAFVVDHGMDRSLALNLHIAGAVGLMIMIAVTARLSDHFGRRPVMLAGVALGLLLAFPLLAMLKSAGFWSVLLAIVAAQMLVQGPIFGPFAAFTAELFPTRIRYTGASLAYQTASTLGAGLTPMIATALYNINGHGTTLITAFLMLCLLVSGLAIWSSREGTQAKLDLL